MFVKSSPQKAYSLTQACNHNLEYNDHQRFLYVSSEKLVVDQNTVEHKFNEQLCNKFLIITKNMLQPCQSYR